MFRRLLLSLLLACGPAAVYADVAFESAHVAVVDELTGEVLLEKDAAAPAPIASMTKLLTAMVVVDANLDPDEPIRIAPEDMDTLKHTHSGVPAGAVVPRGTLLELALIASDNHAAAALARTYPGGLDAFLAAARAKIASLGLASTSLDEPTGLSPNNHSTALDMAKVLQAAAAYPAIADITSKRAHAVQVNGRRWAVRNTNGLVGKPGWEILASKTGFTNEAGRCLTMRLRTAGRTVLVVLMGAAASSERALDALNIRRWLAGEQPLTVAAATPPRRVKSRHVRAARAARARPTLQAAARSDTDG